MDDLVRKLDDGAPSPMPASISTLSSTYTPEDSGSQPIGQETPTVRSGLSVAAGRKRGRGGTGRFKHSWKFPPYIAASKRGSKYAYCKLCNSNFDVTHGGFNDIRRHVQGLRHVARPVKPVFKPLYYVFLWVTS